MDVQILKTTPEECRDYFRRKLAFTIGPVETDYLMSKGEPLTIIDVRAASDYAESHIPGAVNIPEESWNDTSQLSREHVNVIYCYSEVCHLAARAAVHFASKGFRVMEMDGGWQSWKDHKLDIERGAGCAEKTIRSQVA